MTFLNPAVLFGLFAAAIPVLIHLLNLRKLKKIEFSSLQFLKELQKNQIKRIKLKQWLLLALRVLIILLLIGAFARPALRGFAIAGTTSAAKNSAVYIIDDSFSMTAIDANGSLFNQEKQKALECLSLLKEGDDAAVIFVSEAGRKDVKLSKDISSVEKAIHAAYPSVATKTTHEAMIQAAQVLGTSNNFNKEVYVFTDLQQGSIIKDSAYTDLSELLNKRTHLYLFPFQAKSVYNIGIDSLRVNTAIFEKGKPLSVSVFVRNYSDQPARNEVISIFQNKQRTAQKGITLDAKSAAEIVLESPLTAKGFVQITASTEEDDIPADNKRYAVINVPDKIQIGLFVKNPQDAKYFELTLGALDSSGIFQINKRSANALAADDIAKYNSLFLFGFDQSTPQQKLLSYVEKGGGVFIVPSSDASLAEFNSLMQKLNLPVAQNLHQPGSQKDLLLSFSSVDYSHPLFADIFQKGKPQQIQSPEIYGCFQIQPAGSARALFSFADRNMYLAEYAKGKGKMLVAASAFVPQWTNFPYRAFFVPFMFRSVYYLSSLTGVQENCFAGDEMPLPIPQTAFEGLRIVQPGGQEDYLASSAVREKKFYNMTRGGVYSFVANNAVYAMRAVNHLASESNTAVLSVDKFKEYVQKIHFAGTFSSYDRSTDAAQAIKQSRYGAELWKLFLVIALCAALLEMWISKASKKELAIV